MFSNDATTMVARLLGVLNSGVSIANAWLLAVSISELARNRVSSGLWLLGAVVAIRLALTISLAEWNFRVRRSIRTHWRTTLPGHLAIPRLEHERARGDLALAVDHASEAPLLELLSTSARVAIVGFVIVFWAAGWMAALITLGLLVCAIPLYVRAGRRSEAMAIEYQSRRAILESRQLELLTHAPELRALGAVSFGAREIGAISESEHKVALRAIRIALESSLVTEFLSGVSIGLVAMVVGFALLGGRITLIHALIGVLVTSEVFLQVRRFGSEFHRREDAARSRKLLNEVRDRTVQGETGELLTSSDVVTFVNDQAVSLRVVPGDRVLVRGPSGSGKTTLISTWLGWRPAKSGSLVRTDRPVGYISVDSSLLSGSLRENLVLGATIDESRLRQTLDSLGLTGPRFLDLDAPLLGDGRGLSTGERVRLAIARALLADPVILFLDDVAGVLDHNARELVRGTLEGITTLAIVEASVDDPILTTFFQHVEVTG